MGQRKAVERGLKDKDDIPLITSMVAMKPEDVEGLWSVLKNMRVAKFMPYDLLLPKASHIHKFNF